MVFSLYQVIASVHVMEALRPQVEVGGMMIMEHMNSPGYEAEGSCMNDWEEAV